MQNNRSKEYRKQYYLKNREKLTERAKQWRKANPEKVKQIKKKYIKNHPEKVKEWQKNYLNSDYGKLAYRLRQRKYDQRKRLELIEQMGGKCIKCGFNDPRALQIDHINGGGTKENRAMNNHSPIQHMKVIIEGNNTKYQLLCANCNWIKRFENNETVLIKQLMEIEK